MRAESREEGGPGNYQEHETGALSGAAFCLGFSCVLQRDPGGRRSFLKASVFPTDSLGHCLHCEPGTSPNRSNGS